MTATSKLNLNIKPELFSVNFWRVANTPTKYNWLYGGAGSGKTFSIAQYLLLETYKKRAKGKTIYVVKANQSKLENTIINDFHDRHGGGITSMWKIREHFKYSATARTLTNTITGVTIKFMGIDNPEDVKGLTNPYIIFVDEVSDLKIDQYNQLITRVRKEGAKFFFAFNPVDEDHWIKTKVFDLKEENRSIFHTTLYDNKSVTDGKPFIPQEYIDRMEAFKYTDYNYYSVYTLGVWGSTMPQSGRFYKDFNINTHQIQAPVYDKKKPLHISFDFNVNPYMTCTVWQTDGNKVYQIDEVLTKYPLNNTLSCVKEFTKKYHSHEDKIFYYGDPAGKHLDTRSGGVNQKQWNDFDYIEEGLRQANLPFQKRVKRSADRLTVRGIFLNSVFREEIKDLRIFVDESCKVSIKDYLNLLEDMDGSKYKKKIKDPETGVPFEEFGHTSDANDYFLCVYFEREMKAMKGVKTF